MKPQKGWETGSTDLQQVGLKRIKEQWDPGPLSWLGPQVITLPLPQQETRGSFYGSPRLGDSGISGTAEIREKPPYTKQGLQWKCKPRPNTPPHCPSTPSRKGGIQVKSPHPYPRREIKRILLRRNEQPHRKHLWMVQMWVAGDHLPPPSGKWLKFQPNRFSVTPRNWQTPPVHTERPYVSWY